MHSKLGVLLALDAPSVVHERDEVIATITAGAGPSVPDHSPPCQVSVSSALLAPWARLLFFRRRAPLFFLSMPRGEGTFDSLHGTRRELGRILYLIVMTGCHCAGDVWCRRTAVSCKLGKPAQPLTIQHTRTGATAQGPA